MTPERIAELRAEGLIGVPECLDEIERLQAQIERLQSQYEHPSTRPVPQDIAEGIWGTKDNPND